MTALTVHAAKRTLTRMSKGIDRETVISGSATAFVRLSWREVSLLLILIFELVRVAV